MAFSADALKAARGSLKKSALPVVGAVSAVGAIAARRGFDLGSGDPEQISKYQRYIIAFNIERWLERLAGETFATRCVSFDPDTAREFISAYEASREGPAESPPAGPRLAELGARLAAEMSAMGGSCFVKTSSRSAKDHADPVRLREDFRAILASLSDAESENARMVAMSYASMALLRMSDAKRVIEVLCGSERIWHDMKLALSAQGADAGGADPSWAESLALREWTPLEPDMEFRCFVASGKLTAVSQYRALVHFPRLVASWECIRDAITQAFEGSLRGRLEGCFPQDDYVLDVAVELDPAVGPGSILSSEPLTPETIRKVWVIEVNPFFETTDGCLFSWSTDFAVIMGQGQDGMTWRLRETPARGCSSLVYGVWQEIMREAL